MNFIWHPTPVLLPGKSHGQRNLIGYGPWGHYESDTTEQLPFHFSLSCIGEGNGNPLQCFCLENPRDWGAWWASVYGVAQSRTQLKRLSSSSSSVQYYPYLKVHQWAWEERERRSHTVVWDFQFWCGEVNRKVTEEERGLKKLWSDHQDQRALGLFGGVFFERFKT